jgi:hypothetical protein
MGLESPKHLEQVKQIKQSRLLSRIRAIFELGNHHKKPYGKNICNPATNAAEKIKPIALYKLSKIDVNFS